MPQKETLKMDLVVEGALVADKFRLNRLVGAGGMGRVFEAEHVLFKETYAIKFMNPELIGSIEAQQMFVAEARNSRSLSRNNPHVVRVDDVTIWGRQVFIVMELLHGSSLQALIEAGPLSVGQSVEFILQICKGVEGAHSQDIIHRDLKPANVFVERGTSAERAKVLDFGLSKHIMQRSLIQNGVLKGTPLYMSPEQYRATHLDARSDVWALGAILYEMLAGRPPFLADDLPRLVYLITQESPTPLRSIRPDVDSALESIVLRCLDKDAARRYATASELRAALTDALGIEERLGELSTRAHSGDAQRALADLLELRSRYPKDVRIHERLIELFNAHDRRRDALSTLDAAREAGALSGPLLLQAAFAMRSQGNKAAELATLQEALQLGLPPKLQVMAQRRLQMMAEEA